MLFYVIYQAFIPRWSIFDELLGVSSGDETLCGLQYRTLKLKLPKYRMKKSPIPQYRKPPCPPPSQKAFTFAFFVKQKPDEN